LSSGFHFRVLSDAGTLQMEAILKFLQSKPEAEAFCAPVDWCVPGIARALLAESAALQGVLWPHGLPRDHQEAHGFGNHCSALAIALASCRPSRNAFDLVLQKKLEEGKYNTPDKFAADVRLVWKNAMTYNRPDSDIYSTADKLSTVFERKFAKIKGATKPPAGVGAGAAPGAGASSAAGVKR
jgi:hypothetical protein